MLLPGTYTRSALGSQPGNIFGDILSGLDDPRTPSMCSTSCALGGLADRHVFREVFESLSREERALIGLTSFSVGFVDLLRSCYDIGCLQHQAC